MLVVVAVLTSQYQVQAVHLIGVAEVVVLPLVEIRQTQTQVTQHNVGVLAEVAETMVV